MPGQPHERRRHRDAQGRHDAQYISIQVDVKTARRETRLLGQRRSRIRSGGPSRLSAHQTELMASVIEAVIFDGDSAPAIPYGLTTVRLTPEWLMLPVTGKLLEQLDPSTVGDDRIPADWTLKQPVAALTRSISIGRTALYIFSETFGGPGSTEAIAWTDGTVIYGPSGTCDIEADVRPGYRLARGRDSAVNAALRAVGVRASNGQDEYASIGLTKHRMTDDWLRD